MASELCMNCFSVKGQYETCPFCGYAEGTPTEQPHYLKPGTILKEHFIVGTAIGAGGFGIIYKCYDTTLGVIVAIKEFFPVGLVNRAAGDKNVEVMSDERQAEYDIQIKRFLMEAQSIARFGKARDIVNVFDFFQENNTAYIVMEYIDGVLLKDYLDEHGALSVSKALRIIEQITDAVKKIHANGIIHRDISPDNIFIASDGSVKVFDFGAAILSEDDGKNTGEKVIKVGYSAPEQYRDNTKQGYYTDIYSVGAILYQMLTGVKPVESTDREHGDELRSPLALGVKIEANLDRAVMEALAVQPELRFQSIVQFLEAIDGKRKAEYPEQKVKARKRKRVMAVAFSCLVLAAAVIGGLLFNNTVKHSDRLYNDNAKIDKATDIVVWVDNAKMKNTVEKTVSRANMNMRDKKGTVKHDAGEFTKEQKKENPRITVEVVDISAKTSGYKSVEDALKDAEKGKISYPDIVQTDSIPDIKKYKNSMVSFKDNVYAMLNTEDYCYMSAYSKYFPDMKQMPTSFDITLLYTLNNIKTDKKTSLGSGWYNKNDNSDNTEFIELKDILKKADDAENSVYIDDNYVTLLALYQNIKKVNSDGTWDKNDSSVLKTEQKLKEITKKAEKVKWLKSRSDYKKKLKKADRQGKTMYGVNILSGIEFRKELYKTQAEENDGYKMMIPTIDGKMLVRYNGKFSVFDNKDKNRKLAAERLVYYMVAQDDFEDGEMQTYPLISNANGLVAATEISGQKNLVKLINDIQVPCEVLATGMGMTDGH